MALKSPYPYHGGKSYVVDLVWPRLGPDVPNFIDPFFGSNAMALGRPNVLTFLAREGPGKIETINDIDGGIVNFWRAVSYGDEQKVAEWCAWPVSELDLHARHDWLIERLAEMTPQLRADPHFFDEKVAGWWAWGIALWIGSGWCSTPWQQLPAISHGGNARGGTGRRGVLSPKNHKKKPRVAPGGSTGAGTGRVGVLSPANQRGVNRTHLQKPRPHLSSNQGVHAEHRKPNIGNDRGLHGVSAPPAGEWFRELKERTKNINILCGDWKRCLTPSVMGFGKNVGGRSPTAVFLDPVYKTSMRMKNLYNNDAEGLSDEVRKWALDNGDNPRLRIALCGYEGEHEMPDSWECVPWVGPRGYASATNKNRLKERIWFSPHCLKPARQRTLLELIEEAQ